MKTTSYTFDEAARRANQRPWIRVEFPRLPVSLTSYYSDDCQEWELVMDISSFSGTVKPDEGSSDVSSITLEIMDHEIRLTLEDLL